jgi:ABC-type multidrug transport system fused ATPase/permease subunit
LRRSPPAGLRRLRRHVAQRRGWLALLLGCAIVEAFAQSGSWLLVRWAINGGIVPQDDRVLALASAAYLAVSVIGWALFGFVIRGMARFGQELVLGLRRELFDHLTSLSLRYFSEQRAGWIIARLTSDVDAISDVLSQGLPTLVTNAVLLPAAITALFINDWRLALVALVVLPPALVLTRWFQRVSSAAQLEVRNRIAIVTAHLAESVAGMAVVQSFRRESAFQARFDELNADNREANVVAQRISSVFFPSIEFLGVVATVAVLAVGADVLPTSEIGTLTAAYFLLQLVFQPLQELSDIYSQLQSATAAMVKVSAVLDTETDLVESENPLDPRRLDGELRFEGVHFAYGAKRVLHGIDLVIPPGGCTALVGESGGGKSTMAKLVARFYDPLEGSVRADGIDLRELDLHAYRRQLGVVLQDPFLFSGTIADNIAFGRPDATAEEVEAAARAVGAWDFIEALPAGADTEVGERGVQLSAGQRQLVAFARALVADPRILVLDEATSNVDLHTEGRIEDGLRRLLAGRTAIVIAHRLSTIRQAGRIVVLDQGRIVEQGTHDELIGAGGAYAALYADWAAQAVA